MRVLLVTPPMTQLNTPYPATAYLTGFLKMHKVDVVQADPALELVLRLFSRKGLERVVSWLENTASGKKAVRDSAAVRFFWDHRQEYLATVEPVIRLLQGKDLTPSYRIAGRAFLPEGPRFASLDELAQVHEDPLGWSFGALGVQDLAKHLASLYVDDLADMIREGVDEKFQLSRYGEKLAASVPSFSPIQAELEKAPTLVDQILDEITTELVEKHIPDVVGMTAPFPGNVYGAFRMARKIRDLKPETRIALGGGYPNTELRSLSEPRVFDYFDFVTLDDGERPFLCLLEHLQGKRDRGQLLRTFVREEGQVVLKSGAREHDIPHRDVGTPTYEGLPIHDYLQLVEMLNPMQRLWSDGRWNKLTLAHGCYWKKCNFCDVTLDYIGRYDPASADVLVDRIETLIAETGQSGFHFVDEAAPPAVLRNLAQRLMERGVAISWWGNVRFDKTFTPELCELLAKSGCIAVSGGLEVASDRLLKLMNKGVTVEQVARVTKAFTDSGILVHAYLMYGFPTQNEQETVDALERVRQLFEAGCIQSGFWHRFSATAHSPIGKEPEKFGIRILPEPQVSFARNDLAFEDPSGVDHDRLGLGLKKALYNFMLGIGLDADVRFWFEGQVPKAKVPKNLVTGALAETAQAQAR